MKNEIRMLAHQGFWQMMSFIITTEDEKVIVIDGGYSEDAQKLLRELRAITGKEKPHIDAWFLTHAHNDHIFAFAELYENHPDAFTCDGVYYCFPSAQYIGKYESGSLPTIERFRRLLPKFADIAVTVSTGDVYEIGKAAFTVLQTVDTTVTEDIVNNSSTVLRMTLGGKSVLFLGDAGIEAGNRLVERYGDALRSDYCQMAHHGQDGAEKNVYERVRPTACFWCTPEWLWNNDRGDGFDTDIFFTVQTRRWMDEIGTVKHNYITKDGDQTVQL